MKIASDVTMTMKLELTPDVQAGLLSQAQESGLSLEAFAEKVLREKSLESLQNEQADSYAEAMRRLGTFGRRHNLSLGGASVKQLLHESRP
jgi:hypothetical protein